MPTTPDSSKTPEEYSNVSLETKSLKKSLKKTRKGRENAAIAKKASAHDKKQPEAISEQGVTMETEPHPPPKVAMEIPKEWEDQEVLGSKVKDARPGTMREQLGKGKVQITPIAILPGKVEPHTEYFRLGTKVKADYNDIVALAKRGAGRRRVLTNEHFVPDEFEFTREGFTSEETKSLTQQVPPHVRETVSYLLSDVGVSKSDARQYLKSAPSLLGVSRESLREGVETLLALGFTKKQVGWIIPRFPATLSVDWRNLREVYEVMADEVKMKESTIITLMKRHPFLFTLQSSKVKGVWAWPLGPVCDVVFFFFFVCRFGHL